MKAQYKLGTLIEFSRAGASETGVISGIVTRVDGFYYEVKSFDEEVAQKDVLAAYRPVVSRKMKTKVVAKTSKRVTTSKTASQENSLAQ